MRSLSKGFGLSFTTRKAKNPPAISILPHSHGLEPPGRKPNPREVTPLRVLWIHSLGSVALGPSITGKSARAIAVRQRQSPTPVRQSGRWTRAHRGCHSQTHLQPKSPRSKAEVGRINVFKQAKVLSRPGGSLPPPVPPKPALPKLNPGEAVVLEED